jgi:hypothetical protein
VVLTGDDEPAAPIGRSPRSARQVPLLVAAGIAAALAFLLVHRSLVDDAYITMTYARNLAFDLHWGLIPGETANSATSPLNVLLLAAITLVVRSPVVAVGVLLVASIVLAARWLASLSEQLSLSRATPWIGIALLLPSPLLLSTVGLESFLAAALFIGLLRYGSAGMPVAFGVVAGLAVLARPDLGVVVVVTALGFAPVRRKLLRAVVAALGVAVPWHLLSWFALGSAVPDTLLVKIGQGTWAGYGFATGPLMYLHAFPVPTALSFLPVVVGGIALVVLGSLPPGRRGAVQRVAVVSALAAFAHYAVYGFLATPPYHWYYVPSIVGMSICAALVVGQVLVGGSRAASYWVAAAPAVLALAMVVTDVLHGSPWHRSAINSNWASTGEYAQIGRELLPLVGTSGVESPGEIGTLAYYCRCAIVDAFSDRGRMIDLIEARAARSGPMARALIALNYLHLDRGDPPRPAAFRLEFRRHQPSDATHSWQARHWAEGPGRMLLRPLRGPRAPSSGSGGSDTGPTTPGYSR